MANGNQENGQDSQNGNNKKKKRTGGPVGGERTKTGLARLTGALADFFTPKPDSLVDRMNKGTKSYQRGSMGRGGMGR